MEILVLSVEDLEGATSLSPKGNQEMISDQQKMRGPLLVDKMCLPNSFVFPSS